MVAWSKVAFTVLDQGMTGCVTGVVICPCQDDLTVTNPALAQALQDEVKTHRDEIAELEGERDKIDRRLVELRRRETALEQARLLLLPPSETNGNGHGLSKRDAVLGYLSERPGKRVSFEEIFTALVERNQIAGDRRTRKTLQMTLSMLYKEKRVKRPEVA